MKSPRGCLLSVAMVKVSIGFRHIVVELGAGYGEWSEAFMRHQLANFGVTFMPILVEVNTAKREALQHIATKWGGLAIIAAAWTRAGRQRLVVPKFRGDVAQSVFSSSIYSDIGSGFHTVNVPSISVAELLMNHTTEGDRVVMRADVEGAEYEILRDLLLKGIACRLEKLFVEVHAMYSTELQNMRPLDVSLPWLLEPCVEVYVTQNYFTDPAIAQNWPQDDGDCKHCPMLYRPLTGPDCPVASDPAVRFGQPSCFNSKYTCERCCDLSKGPHGDQQCWNEPDFTYSECCVGMPPPEVLGRISHPVHTEPQNRIELWRLRGQPESKIEAQRVPP